MLHAYRYTFNDDIKHADILETYDLARLAIESIYGDARVRLESRYEHDSDTRTIWIIGNYEIGNTLNLVFVGFASREFGAGSFVVEAVDQA